MSKSKLIFSAVLVALSVLSTGCATTGNGGPVVLDTGRLTSTTNMVANGVANNTIVNAGDSTECGAQALINNMITRAITKNNRYADYSNTGNFDRCLWMKQNARDQAREQAMWQAQRDAEEAKRRAPQCDYSLRESTDNGNATTSRTRDCRESRYEKWQ